MKIYKTVSAHLPMKAFVDDLKEYGDVIESSGRKTQAKLVAYWLKQLQGDELSQVAANALWAGIQIGGALERANTEQAFSKPILKQAKAVKTRELASKKQAVIKKKSADTRILKEWQDFQNAHPEEEAKRLYMKFKKGLTDRRQRRFSALVAKPM